MTSSPDRAPVVDAFLAHAEAAGCVRESEVEGPVAQLERADTAAKSCLIGSDLQRQRKIAAARERLSCALGADAPLAEIMPADQPEVADELHTGLGRAAVRRAVAGLREAA